MSLENSKSFKDIADDILKQIKNGTSPLLKQWDVAPSAPHNPISGTNYRGVNNMSLQHQGRTDPRWMTYKQAASKDYQVRKGEKGSPIVYWQFNKEVAKKDASGKVIKTANGKTAKESIRLARPRLFGSTVFNAEQIDGIPPMEKPNNIENFKIHDRAEGILKESGADISYGGNRAFYSPSQDRIQLPERESFKSEAAMYAVAMHEIGHWTSAPDRLDRELGGKFGTPEYAKEELRAEIFSFMASSELEIPFDPSQHVAYVEDWVRILEDQPTEIYKASRDAEQIKDYVLKFDRTLDQEQSQEQTKTADRIPEINTPRSSSGSDDEQSKEPAVVRSVDVKTDLKKACEDMGLVMGNFKGKDHPVMDGTFHRVPVERTDDKKNTDGSYKAFTDGVPAGVIINHYSGQKRNWKANSVAKALTPDERKAISEQTKINSAKTAEMTTKMYEHKARRVEQLLSVMPKATDDNKYLQTKGIKASDNVHEDKRGRLVVPVTDAKGKVQSMVRINSTGSFKQNLKGGKLAGGMHMIGKPKAGESVIVTEGYSTAKTLNEATGLPTAAAFSANNLANVAHAVQQAYTASTVFVAGDNDVANDRNVGRIKATEAAQAVGTQAIFPKLPSGAKGSDFNDLGKISGSAEVRSQVEAGIKRGRAAEPHQQREVKKELQKERTQERSRSVSRSR